MIDLHCHILPELDDGAKTMEEALQMCSLSCRDGVRTIVATPHILKGVYPNNRSTILAKFQELSIALIHSSLFPPHFSLKVLPSADVHFSEDLLRELECGNLLTVEDGGKFLFIEFPFQGIPYRAEEVLFRLLGKGVTPIITHPERNFEISERPHRYLEMVRMGCLGQVTSMSLTGEFGSKVRKVSEWFLEKRLLHIISSDGHSINGRMPVLSKGVKAAEKIVGKEEALMMVTEYPEAIIQGRRPDVPEPLSPF